MKSVETTKQSTKLNIDTNNRCVVGEHSGFSTYGQPLNMLSFHQGYISRIIYPSKKIRRVLNTLFTRNSLSQCSFVVSYFIFRALKLVCLSYLFCVWYIFDKVGIKIMSCQLTSYSKTIIDVSFPKQRRNQTVLKCKIKHGCV